MPRVRCLTSLTARASPASSSLSSAATEAPPLALRSSARAAAAPSNSSWQVVRSTRLKPMGLASGPAFGSAGNSGTRDAR